MPQVIFHAPEEFYFNERFTTGLIAKLCEEVIDEFFTDEFVQTSLTYNETRFQSNLKVGQVASFLENPKKEVNSITLNRLLNEPLSVVIFLEDNNTTCGASFTISSKSNELNQKVYEFLKERVYQIKKDLVLKESEKNLAQIKIDEDQINENWGNYSLAKQLLKSFSATRQKRKLYICPGIFFFQNQISWKRLVASIQSDVSAFFREDQLSIYAVREPLVNLQLKDFQHLIKYLRNENLDDHKFRITEKQKRTRQIPFVVELHFRKAIDAENGARYSLSVMVSSNVAKLSENAGKKLVQGLFLELEQFELKNLSGKIPPQIRSIQRNNQGILIDIKKEFELHPWKVIINNLLKRYVPTANLLVALKSDQGFNYFFPDFDNMQIAEINLRRGIQDLQLFAVEKPGDYLILEFDLKIPDNYQLRLIHSVQGVLEKSIISELKDQLGQEDIFFTNIRKIKKKRDAPKIKFPEKIKPDKNEKPVELNSNQFFFSGKLEEEKFRNFLKALDKSFHKEKHLLISFNKSDTEKAGSLYNILEFDQLWREIQQNGYPDNIFASKINEDKDFVSVSLNFGQNPYGTVSAQTNESSYRKLHRWVLNNFADLKTDAPENDSKPIKPKKKSEELLFRSFVFHAIKNPNPREAVTTIRAIDQLISDRHPMEVLVETTYGKLIHLQGKDVRQLEVLLKMMKVASITLDKGEGLGESINLEIILRPPRKKARDLEGKLIISTVNKKILLEVERLVLNTFSSDNKKINMHTRQRKSETEFLLKNLPSPDLFLKLFDEIDQILNKEKSWEIKVWKTGEDQEEVFTSDARKAFRNFLLVHNNIIERMQIISEKNYALDMFLKIFVLKIKENSLKLALETTSPKENVSKEIHQLFTNWFQHLSTD